MPNVARFTTSGRAPPHTPPLFCMKSSIPFGLDCCASSGSRSSLPLVKQAKLIGVLYLENNLASHVFTPSRISVLELLASQAAISLENARLYSDLQEREARIRRLVDSNII